MIACSIIDLAMSVSSPSIKNHDSNDLREKARLRKFYEYLESSKFQRHMSKNKAQNRITIIKHKSKMLINNIFQYLRSMNNYTGVFEVNSALRSAEVNRLDHTVKKLFKEKEEILKEVHSKYLVLLFYLSSNFRTL